MTATDAPVDLEETYRETRYVPVADLRHFPGNANKGDVPKIRESIRSTGQYRALIVRDEGEGVLTVLAGNNTLDALTAEGRDVARCEIHVCDDRTATKINVADNQIARYGVVDEDALLEQLSFLEGDYEGSGFTEGQINHMLGEGGGFGDDHETAGLTDNDDDRDTATTDDDDESSGAPGSAGLLDRPENDRYREQYGVIVMCGGEEHQQEVYQDLRDQGFNVKVVTV